MHFFSFWCITKTLLTITRITKSLKMLPLRFLWYDCIIVIEFWNLCASARSEEVRSKSRNECNYSVFGTGLFFFKICWDRRHKKSMKRREMRFIELQVYHLSSRPLLSALDYFICCTSSSNKKKRYIVLLAICLQDSS